LAVQFTDASTGAATWSWTFGDGTTSTTQNPSHTYTDAGTYNATLTVTNQGGSSSKLLPISVTISPPVANFTATPTSGPVPLVVQFTDTSTGAASWSWTFGDGTTSAIQNPSHTYTNAGTYTATLTVTNPEGTSRKPLLIPVTLAPPIADFTATPTTGTVPLTVQFTDASTGATSWSWVFGDGVYSTEQNPAHVYATAGTYTVVLTATNAGGSSVITKPGYISVAPPDFYADFTVSPVEGTAPLTVKCNDKSIGNPTWFAYDFGDGVTISNPNPIHSYALPGVYNITLTIMKFDRSTFSTKVSSTTKQNVVTVSRVPFIQPVAKFTASPVQGTAPLSVGFTDLSSGNPTYYNYDFGDGVNITEQNPVHSYRYPGTYTVTLTVLKNDAATGTIAGDSFIQQDLIVVEG
jgi:PKD repeat protein